ncbi:ATP synthase F1 subunit delta [Persicitalea jodogahamensis]|uniref:ATP synthase subunit delta n=1 Tax=Persicitalea jodogahamensis TaxID=402147 RepID=A0A8J3D4K8_9BACT|nr:ATP synthase F1 subunit delta [Persicitalea jodogahamensis]GHB58883.1 ATP synthase subunit delta [Persicitalea jodogahamensis]
MSVGTVATRYAKSLIELAEERKVVETVYQDMLLFRDTAKANRGLMLALKSPVVRHEKKLGILNAIFKDRVDPVSYSIFEIITRKNRESILDEIATEFITQYNSYKGIQKATITTTIPLNTELREQFNKIVADATGKTVELEERVEEKLIGGYILRVGDRQIDASLKSRLNELKLELID